MKQNKNDCSSNLVICFVFAAEIGMYQQKQLQSNTNSRDFAPLICSDNPQYVGSRKTVP